MEPIVIRLDRPSTRGEVEATYVSESFPGDLTVRAQDGHIVRVTSPLDHSVTHGSLCIKGRFGWQFVEIQKAPQP